MQNGYQSNTTRPCPSEFYFKTRYNCDSMCKRLIRQNRLISISILGEGTSGAISFSPQVLDFKTLLLGNKRTLLLKIKNNSDCNLKFGLEFVKSSQVSSIDKDHDGVVEADELDAYQAQQEETGRLMLHLKNQKAYYLHVQCIKAYETEQDKKRAEKVMRKKSRLKKSREKDMERHAALIDAQDILRVFQHDRQTCSSKLRVNHLKALLLHAGKENKEVNRKKSKHLEMYWELHQDIKFCAVVGTKISRFFGEDLYNGCVTDINEDKYTVIYDDGDRGV